MEELKIKQETMDNQKKEVHGCRSAFQASPNPSIREPMVSLPYTSDLANYMVRKEMVSSGLMSLMIVLRTTGPGNPLFKM